MFTGIVAALGRITKMEPLGGADAGVRSDQIAAGALGLDDVAMGDSIAIQGACMTVVSKERGAVSTSTCRARACRKPRGLTA